MTPLRATGRLLKASIAERILTYLLLPFGQEGHTNKGRLTASAGSVQIPADVSTIHLNIEHDDIRPVGRAVQVDEQPEGLVASFAIAKTSAGDDLLVEAEDGLRAGISVELDEPVIRAGRLVSALLTGAGAVTQPAFASALLLAADAGQLEGTPTVDPIAQAIKALEDAVQLLKDAQTPADVTEAVAIVEEALVPVTQPEAPVTDPVLARQARLVSAQARQALTAAATGPKTERPPASAPGGLRASAPAGRRGTKSPTARDVFRLLADAHRTGGERRVLAALADVIPGDIVGIEQPQFVGELWSGRAYQRRYVPLFNHGTLTSFEVKGWRWVTKPVMGPYAGNKAEPPTAEIETEPVTVNASRLAGAHDIDRKFRDFNDAGFWEAYYKAMTESYAMLSDAAAISAAITAAGPAIAVGDIPTGVSEGMTKIVDGALAVLTGANALPTFAVASVALYREILLTRSDDTLTYLNAALGLEDGTVQSFRVLPGSTLGDDEVLVGASEAMTFHELGETPIRIEAENVSLGGIDAGVFGYHAENVHDSDALVLVADEEGSV